jgi:5S rRNA maturation endonuclease (ribonuclease M5)
MKNTVLLLVEGKSDLIFLRDIISSNYEKKSVANKIEKKIISEATIEFETFTLLLKVCNLNENINNVGGWTNLKALAASIAEEKYKEYLILFDSDFSGKNIKHKEKEIKKWVGEKFEYSTFYFPYNDTEKGEDLEELVELCISENYNQFIPCWKNFENCLQGKIQDEINYPDRKRKIFSFKDSLKNVDQNIHESYLKDTIWNINFITNQNLIPLKTFLDKHLI